MLAFSIDYYGIFFGATQSVELFCTYLFVGRVIARLRRNYEKIITSDIDADSIVEMIYMDSANEG